MNKQNSPNNKSIEEIPFSTSDKIQIFAFLFFLVAFIIYTQFFIGPRKFGERIECDSVEIYYNGGVTKTEVTDLCTILAPPKINENAQGISSSVLLSKNEKAYILKFVLKKEMQKEEDIIYALKEKATAFSQKILGGENIEIHICDTGFNTITIL